VEAYKWFYLAHKNGNGVANHYLVMMEGKSPLGGPTLTSEQIAEAVRRADQFQESIKNGKQKG